MSAKAATTAETTKERILDAAEGLLLAQGFNGTGINDVLRTVGIPKGSFYHWFPSKEQFGVELLQHYAAQSLAQKRKWLTKTATLPQAADRLISLMESTVTCVLDHDCQHICLLVKLTNEVSSWSEAMRQELMLYFQETVALYREVIEWGQQHGQISKKIPAGQMASTVHDVWLGAYMRTLTLRSPEPLRQSLTFLKHYLAAP